MKRVIEIDENHFKVLQMMSDCGLGYYNELILASTPLEDEFEKIKTEIREWYWQADKQKISKDPCVVDAMIDLFIRTVDNHISEMKGKNE